MAQIHTALKKMTRFLTIYKSYVLIACTAINLFLVFLTFDVDKIEKICLHLWKKHLNIRKIAKFETDTS